MAIYLDDQTRGYLERKFKTVPEKDFIGKRIQKMLHDDRERLRLIGECQHQEGEYIGEKVCCAKCGANYKYGHGEQWTNKEAYVSSNIF